MTMTDEMAMIDKVHDSLCRQACEKREGPKGDSPQSAHAWQPGSDLYKTRMTSLATATARCSVEMVATAVNRSKLARSGEPASFR